MQYRVGPLACILPRGDMAKVFIVALRFAICCLKLFTKMAPARLCSLKCIKTHQLRQLDEVSDPSRFFKRLIYFIVAAEHVDVSPKLFPDCGIFSSAYCKLRSVRTIPQSFHSSFPSS